MKRNKMDSDREEVAIETKKPCLETTFTCTATSKDESLSGISDDTKMKTVEKMHNEFTERRKIIVSNLPTDSSEKVLKEILEDDEFTMVSSVNDGNIKLVFPNSSTARCASLKLHGYKNGNKRLMAHFGHPDSLLFVGNVPLAYTHEKLRELFSPYGVLLRCFVVHSVLTGLSKGYGFVEFATRENALSAKNKMATRVVGSRSLRVDFADNGMQTCEDLQSKTVFVDKLPKGMSDESKLMNLFKKYGTVNFCQIALTSNGLPRGFAFVDMSTSQEAEDIHTHCNGAKIDGQEIRISYGMPCRPGACILQPRNTNPYTNVWSTNIVPPVVSASIPVMMPEGIYSEGNIPTFSTSHTYSLTCPASSSGTFSSSSVTVPTFTVPTLSTLLHTHNIQPLTSQVEDQKSISDTDSNVLKENIPEDKKPTTGKKRHLQDDDDLMAIYDKPYIGQHDQGIPFTHPLKRIKKY